jgi:hypothetical protein
MVRYSAMHSEYYGLLFGRKIRPADRSFHALNAHMGPVNHLRHDDQRVSRRSPTATLTPWDSNGRKGASSRRERNSLALWPSLTGDRRLDAGPGAESRISDGYAGLAGVIRPTSHYPLHTDEAAVWANRGNNSLHQSGLYVCS